MPTSRNQIVSIIGSHAFASGVAALAGEITIVQVARPEAVSDDCDAVVWHLAGDFNMDTLASVAGRLPTLVVADESQMLPAVDSGARGFLPAGSTLSETSEAIQTILQGGSVIPSDLLGRLLQYVVARRRAEDRPPEAVSGLTPREREVYDLANSGLRRSEIAERLFISEGTVRTHLQRVYRKLGVHSQAELIATKHRDLESEELK